MEENNKNFEEMYKQVAEENNLLKKELEKSQKQFQKVLILYNDLFQKFLVGE